MELDETSLRQLLNSPHGAACGMAILDGVAHGKPLEVQGTDGYARAFAKASDALDFLLQLGWRADPAIAATYSAIPADSRT